MRQRRTFEHGECAEQRASDELGGKRRKELAGEAGGDDRTLRIPRALPMSIRAIIAFSQDMFPLSHLSLSSYYLLL